ncbi:MAG: efflux RND transporter permease subunit [Acidobacteriota bacterium]|nr:efflux RND transporter permease subunit [Acidobacteriota bacterium]
MLVDNAIVVVEAIYRRLDAGGGRLEAIVQGTGEVAGAIGASTLTTCIVFLPVLFVQGLAARLVEGLSLAVMAALLVSLLAAVFLIPALSTWLLPRERVRAFDPGRRAVERLTGRAVEHPWLVLLAATAAVAGSGWGLGRLGTELLPPADPQSFSLRLVAKAGMPVEATAEVAGRVEDILREASHGTAQAILSEVGRLPEDDRQVREEQFEENTARITVSLSGEGPGAREVVAAARDAVASLAGLSVEWELGGSALARSLGHMGAPLAVEIGGRSLADLREASVALRRRAAARAELWNVRSSLEGGPPELHVVIDRNLADALGVTPQLVARSLQAALEGFDVTRLVRGDEELEVTLHTPRIRRDQLERLPLSPPAASAWPSVTWPASKRSRARGRFCAATSDGWRASPPGWHRG